MIFLRLCFGYLVQVVPFAFMCFLPFADNFRFSKKRTAVLTGWILTGCASLFSALGWYFSHILPGNHTLFQVVNLTFMFSMLPCLFWYIYAIKNIWQKKLFVFSFSLTCALAVNSVSNLINTWLYRNIPGDGLPYKGATTLVLLSFTLLFLPIWKLLNKKYYSQIRESFDPKESEHLSILSLLLFLLLASGLSFLNYTELFSNAMTLFLYFALLATTYIVYLLSFKIFASLHKRYLTENRCLKVEYNMQLLNKQYVSLLDSMENGRRLRHDLKHHMLAIREYLNENEIEKAKAYIQQYLHFLQEFEHLKFCDHPITNMIVSHYYSFAREHNITFYIHASLPRELPITDADLTVLLGNLLENATTAASMANEKNRCIHLNMILHRKMLAITVDNSFSGNISCTQDGDYLSTKKEHTGLGLKSISEIAAKYNGGVEFHHNDTAFHACVMLGLDSK